ncbi:Zinc finger protein CONSTANS-LIKE 5-like protein [Drosera capensis]
MMIGDENVKGILTGWGLTTKPCDSCKKSSAILFCRRDSAFLCGACDAKIHENNNSNNNNNHERVILCEVCEQAPAAVTCKADAAALCVSCDHDIHSVNPLASRHDRVPVVPFFHSSAVAAAPKSSSAFLVPENNNTDVAEAWLMPNPGGSKVAANDFFLSDIDALLNFNYTAPSLDIKPPLDNHRRNINSGDSVVPTFAAANGNLISFVNHHPKENNYFDIDIQEPKISPFTRSVSSSDMGIVPDGNSNSHTEVSNYSFPKTIEATAAAAPPPVQLSREEREARVMRYREKRKNRKFEKTIRYASRKAYAESRPRIKGRFAKRGETDADEGMMMFGGGGGRGGVGGYFMVDDGGFGVVPSF